MIASIFRTLDPYVFLIYLLFFSFLLLQSEAVSQLFTSPSQPDLFNAIAHYIRSVYFMEIATQLIRNICDQAVSDNASPSELNSRYGESVYSAQVYSSEAFAASEQCIRAMSKYVETQARVQSQAESQGNSAKSRAFTKQEDFIWYIPILGRMLLLLRRTSALADRVASSGVSVFLRGVLSHSSQQNQNVSGESINNFDDQTDDDSLPPLSSTKCSHESYELLMGLMRIVNLSRARAEEGPKCAYLLITNTLLRVLVRMNATDRCANVVTQTETAVGKNLQMFPPGQRATYMYFRGMISLFREQYADAEASLESALSTCPSRSHPNTRKILALLLPLKMLNGVRVSESFARRVGFPEYAELAMAISAGEVPRYQRCLAAHEVLFISRGVFLVIEKLRNTLFQNLCRKVYLAKLDGEEKIPKLRHSYILAALRLQQKQENNGVIGDDFENMTIDELECIIASLIYEKKIKGYIAHGVCTILDKNDPFPRK